jgi:hypothetical protein
MEAGLGAVARQAFASSTTRARDAHPGVDRESIALTPPAFLEVAPADPPPAAALAHHGWQQHCRGLLQIPIAA